MAVTGPATPLSAVLSQIQAPLRTTAATPPQAKQPTAAARQSAQAQPAVSAPNGDGRLNPNAPRGTYLNIVV